MWAKYNMANLLFSKSICNNALSSLLFMRKMVAKLLLFEIFLEFWEGNKRY